MNYHSMIAMLIGLQNAGVDTTICPELFNLANPSYNFASYRAEYEKIMEKQSALPFDFAHKRDAISSDLLKRYKSPRTRQCCIWRKLQGAAKFH